MGEGYATHSEFVAYPTHQNNWLILCMPSPARGEGAIIAAQLAAFRFTPIDWPH